MFGVIDYPFGICKDICIVSLWCIEAIYVNLHGLSVYIGSAVAQW